MTADVVSPSFDQRKWDYDAMTIIADHLRENPAHPLSGRQCAEFVLDARDRLYGEGELRQCGWCGEAVAGPCDHPGDPCGLYGDPPETPTPTAPNPAGQSAKGLPVDGAG